MQIFGHHCGQNLDDVAAATDADRPVDDRERIGALASRRGVSAASWIVECAFSVDADGPGTRVVARDEMQPLLEWVERIEERAPELTPETLSVLETLAAAIGLLTRWAMMEMMPEFRDKEIVSLLGYGSGRIKPGSAAPGYMRGQVPRRTEPACRR